MLMSDCCSFSHLADLKRLLTTAGMSIHHNLKTFSMIGMCVTLVVMLID
jgi:hypothetical protein